MNKKINCMKKFIISKISLRNLKIPFPTMKQCLQSIKDTNPNIENILISRDLCTDSCCVVCKNKPRDLLIYGVKWIEVL